jgi:hypothetical protein
MSTDRRPAGGDAHDATRIVVTASIALLCLAALVAIGAVLSGNGLDEDAARALGTAAALTIYMLAGLAGRSLSERRSELSALGWITVLIAAAGFLVTVVAIWSEDGGDDDWKAAGCLLVATLATAHVSLLLRGASPEEPDSARFLRWGTVLVATLLATMLIVEIAEGGEAIDPQGIGVVAILYVLGTVLLPLVRAGSTPRREASEPTASAPVAVRARESAQGREGAGPARRGFRGVDLRRVLIAPPHESQGLRILSAEVYADGITVRYAVPNFGEQLAERGDRWKPPHDEYPFRLTDDLGTRYAIHSASGRANEVFHGQVTFVPTAASEARRLRLETAIGTLDLELDEGTSTQ